MIHTHTIPVDPSQTAAEAWRELCIFTKRVTWTGSPTWAVIDCDGEECINIDRSRVHVFFNDSLVSGPEGCDCEACYDRRNLLRLSER